MLLIEKTLFNKSLAFGEGLKNANNIEPLQLPVGSPFQLQRIYPTTQ
jgi:hypothetical protein